MTELMSRRDAVLGPKMTTFYTEPVEIVRGQGVWLWDTAGNELCVFRGHEGSRQFPRFRN